MCRPIVLLGAGVSADSNLPAPAAESWLWGDSTDWFDEIEQGIQQQRPTDQADLKVEDPALVNAEQSHTDPGSVST